MADPELATWADDMLRLVRDEVGRTTADRLPEAARRDLEQEVVRRLVLYFRLLRDGDPRMLDQQVGAFVTGYLWGLFGIEPE